MHICVYWSYIQSLSFRQLDVRLLEKMRLNCQVFKEEISMVHLNRQVAHLQSALQESYAKVIFIECKLPTPPPPPALLFSLFLIRILIYTNAEVNE